MQLGDRKRWIDDSECRRNTSHVCDVAVTLIIAQLDLSVAIMRSEKRIDLCKVDPLEQMRIIGFVGATVSGSSRDTFMNFVHHVDCSLGFFGWSECRRGEEVGCSLESSPWVVLVVGVLSDTCHCEWMQ